MNEWLYFLLGLLTGGIGTLVGAGGGFLLTPVFILLFPEMPPARLTALTLLAISANSTSGSIAYAFRNRVHWPSVALFSLFAFPGVYLGVQLNQIVPRYIFEEIFAVFLFSIAVFVFWRSFHKSHAHVEKKFWNRRSKILGSLMSFFIGILASLLGIGGGIVHVPLLSEVLRYPIHLAAGTSHAILALTSATAVVQHWYSGDLEPLESFVPHLVAGLIIGAQTGAAVSHRVASRWILRTLGVALFLVATRLFIRNLHAF